MTIRQAKQESIYKSENAYHGSTIAAASLGGMSAMHKQARGLDYVYTLLNHIGLS